MKDPVILTTCGHSFEKATILEWQKKNAMCPICKLPFSQDDVKTNFALKWHIDELKKIENSK